MIRHGHDFILVPWQQDFLKALLDFALEDTRGAIDDALFIFPNSRPEKYLSRLLREDARIKRPLIMPAMVTVSALFRELRGRIQSRPAWEASPLDRVGLLLRCAREERFNDDRADSGRQGDKDPAAQFLHDAGHFFPWGVRLAGLFEECFVQGKKAENFLYAEGAVSPYAEKLLSRLGNLYHRYVDSLEDMEWTTPGRDAAIVAEYLEAFDQLPAQGPEPARVYIAGFHALTRAENRLFHHLWQRGARVLVHADPALVEDGVGGPASGSAKAHWSCSVFSEWAEEWKTRLVTAPGCGNERPEPRIRFYQGFDLHSQLRVLEKELRDLSGDDNRTMNPEQFPDAGADDAGERDKEADTVVVLPDSGLLMPVLHHLPRTDINVSMGYPLERSPLFRLLDTILRLQEGRRGRQYYWRDLLDLIRHPYLKMLRPGVSEGAAPEAGVDENSDPAPLRRELQGLEKALRANPDRYPDPFLLLEHTYQSQDAADLPPAPVLNLVERLFAVCLGAFEDKATPAELGSALESLCSLLLDCGAHLWERFLIDAECLFRIMQSLIPELSRSFLARERLPSDTLTGILRRLMQAERVPFEASPLVGLQVMGILETRLLSFRRVLVLDAGEHSLPGSPAGDPLLPEALRPVLGLPSLAGREQVAAYNFFRLIAGAGEVVLLWEEGGDTPGLQEQKKKKSRFVEELVWREEKRRGRILTGEEEDGPLRHLTASVAPVPKRNTGIPLTDAVRDTMREILSGPVSASLLDSYLRCPAQFYYRHLAALKPMEEVSEGDDPLQVGNLFHSVLQQCYTLHTGRELPGSEELLALLGEDMTAALLSSPVYAALSRSLPADSAVMLRRAGEHRIREYLLHQPPTMVLSLETPLCADLEHAGDKVRLYGKADRIDLRLFDSGEGEFVPGIHILDYKTGRLPEIRNDFWHNETLWERMEAWRPEQDVAAPDTTPLLQEIAGNLQSLQLPFYLLLYGLGGTGGRDDIPTDITACNAAWVELADKGEEKMLFPAPFSQFPNRDFVLARGKSLVRFLLRHMLGTPVLSPVPGEHCRWCFSAKLCIEGRS